MRVALALAGIGLLAGAAFAEPLPARLDFRTEAGGCPDERALRAGVIARLGSDPFHDDAARTIAVRLGGAPGAWKATITLGRARRSLSSRALECAGLAEATELSVALAIDPLWQPPPAPPPPEALPAAEPPAQAPPPPPRRSLVDEVIIVDEEVIPPAHDPGPWQLGVGSFLTLGVSPDLIAGVRVEIGLRSRHGSLALEPWLTLPAGTGAPGGHVTVGFTAASLVGCHTLSIVDVCAQVSGGLLHGVGEGAGFEQRRSVEMPFAAAGARVVYVVPLARGLDARGYVDGLVPLTHTRLYADSLMGKLPAWTMPYVLPSVGAALVGHFP